MNVTPQTDVSILQSSASKLTCGSEGVNSLRGPVRELATPSLLSTKFPTGEVNAQGSFEAHIRRVEQVADPFHIDAPLSGAESRESRSPTSSTYSQAAQAPLSALNRQCPWVLPKPVDLAPRPVRKMRGGKFKYATRASRSSFAILASCADAKARYDGAMDARKQMAEESDGSTPSPSSTSSPTNGGPSKSPSTTAKSEAELPLLNYRVTTFRCRDRPTFMPKYELSKMKECGYWAPLLMAACHLSWVGCYLIALLPLLAGILMCPIAGRLASFAKLYTYRVASKILWIGSMSSLDLDDVLRGSDEEMIQESPLGLALKFVLYLLTSLESLNSSVGYSANLVCFYVGYHKVPLTRQDNRPVAVRSGLSENDEVIVKVYRVVNVENDTCRTIITNSDIEEPVATRLESMPSADAAKMAHVLCTRVTNLHLPKEVTNQIYTGAAFLSQIRASNSRLRTSLSLGTAGSGMMTLAIFVVALVVVYLFPNANVDTLTMMCVIYGAPVFEEFFKANVDVLGSFSYSEYSITLGLTEFVVRVVLLLIEQGVPDPLTIAGREATLLLFRACLRNSPALLMHMLLPVCRINKAGLHMLFNLAAVTTGLFSPGSSQLPLAAAFFAVCLYVRLNPAIPHVPRMYGFGYRYGDAGIVLPEPVDYDCEIDRHGNFEECVERKPMQVGLGPIIDGVAAPMADVRHHPSLLKGCLCRYAATPPVVDDDLLEEFHQYVVNMLPRMFQPLAADLDLSHATWIEKTTYTRARKDELIKLYYDDNGVIRKEYRWLKGFGKVETYNKYKSPRAINSRSDSYKNFCGPLFSAIENVVFQHPSFIKHVPVCDRPAYITSMLSHYPGPFYETDYTSFESLFQKKVMARCEMELYKHMLINFPGLYGEVSKTLLGVNKIRYKGFTIKIQARRMSGEMCTSLGNGFSNLLLAMFVADYHGGKVIGVVEGDDGLFYSNVKMPSITFLRLGFRIKILEHMDLLRSSFCGLVMSADLITMTDPRKVLANFGWTHSPEKMGGPKVLLGLLRAKALSLLYEHPRCPILSVLAKRYIYLTEAYQPRFSRNWYEQNLVREVTEHTSRTMAEARKGPSIQARVDFAELYGIDLPVQYALEEYLSTATIGSLSHWSLDYIFSETTDPMRHYWAHYVRSDALFE